MFKCYPLWLAFFTSHKMFHFLPHCLIKTERNANWETVKTCLCFASRLIFTYKPTHWSYSVFRSCILFMKSTASAVALVLNGLTSAESVFMTQISADRPWTWSNAKSECRAWSRWSPSRVRSPKHPHRAPFPLPTAAEDSRELRCRAIIAVYCWSTCALVKKKANKTFKCLSFFSLFCWLFPD